MYLERIDRIVGGYVTTLGPRKAELFGPKAGDHWKAIGALARSEFPERELAYLVDYGVYGLAQTYASR